MPTFISIFANLLLELVNKKSMLSGSALTFLAPPFEAEVAGLGPVGLSETEAVAAEREEEL